jgi:hypothetical protein
MCNKWEGIVDDHRLYDERFLEAVAVLSYLEDKVQRLEKDEQLLASMPNGSSPVPPDLPSSQKTISAQDVITARQKGSHQLSFVATQVRA